MNTAASTVLWPLAARGQQNIPRIGYLGPAPADADREHIKAFREGLRDLGYIDGKTIEIMTRWPERGVERLMELASELVALKVDVIVTGAQGIYEAHKATATIPIVSGAGGDLVGLGLADSLGHPGGNVTGLTILGPQLLVKRVELLKRINPSMKTLGLLLQRGALSIPTYVRALEGPTQSIGFSLELIEVANIGECENALTTGPGAMIDGLLLSDYPLFASGSSPTKIAAIAVHRGLPSAGHLTFARSGGLIAYGVDLPSMFRSAGRFVDKILKGAKPGDLPIEQATKFITIINLKTAAALGLELSPKILAGADEVIG